jgi:hypothetical protein
MQDTEIYDRTVYAVMDNDHPDVVRYIGEASDAERRVKTHLVENNAASPKTAWFHWMNYIGAKPTFRVLECWFSDDRKDVRKLARQAEHRLIMENAKKSPLLLNQPWWGQAMESRGVPPGVAIDYIRAIKLICHPCTIKYCGKSYSAAPIEEQMLARSDAIVAAETIELKYPCINIRKIPDFLLTDC